MLKDILKLFKPYRKGMGVAYYLKILDNNKGLNFQMNFLRSGIYMDLQVYRYKSIIAEEIDPSHKYNPDDYVLSINFSKKDENFKECFERFNQSYLFSKAHLVYVSKNESTKRFNLYLEQDNRKLFDLIKFILEHVFSYDKNTTYQILFHKLK